MVPLLGRHREHVRPRGGRRQRRRHRRRWLDQPGRDGPRPGSRRRAAGRHPLWYFWCNRRQEPPVVVVEVRLGRRPGLGPLVRFELEGRTQRPGRRRSQQHLRNRCGWREQPDRHRRGLADRSVPVAHRNHRRQAPRHRDGQVRPVRRHPVGGDLRRQRHGPLRPRDRRLRRHRLQHRALQLDRRLHRRHQHHRGPRTGGERRQPARPLPGRPQHGRRLLRVCSGHPRQVVARGAGQRQRHCR